MTDRFGNAFASGLPYARGELIRATHDDYRKLEQARRVIQERIARYGPGGVFNLSGLRRSLPSTAVAGYLLDDELAPAMVGEVVKDLGLQHLGGNADEHDVMLFNRLTAAVFAVNIAIVVRGDVVIGFSSTYSHPVVTRSARQQGAVFVDTNSVGAFDQALSNYEKVALVVVTRLAVTYDLLDEGDIREAVQLAHEHGIPVLIDDAGGARVGPAIFGQARSLELGADLAATGLDKYGTLGPRLGLLAGERDLVASIRATAFEYGLEARPMLYPHVVDSLRAFDPGAVVESARITRQVGESLRAIIGDSVRVDEITAQIGAEDLLSLVLERAALPAVPVVPYEVTACTAMRLLVDYGILTVHFAGMPPGTSALLFKFIDPDELERFGGPDRLAEAVDDVLTKLARALGEPEELGALLYGQDGVSTISDGREFEVERR